MPRKKGSATEVTLNESLGESDSPIEVDSDVGEETPVNVTDLSVEAGWGDEADVAGCLLSAAEMATLDEMIASSALQRKPKTRSLLLQPDDLRAALPTGLCFCSGRCGRLGKEGTQHTDRNNKYCGRYLPRVSEQASRTTYRVAPPGKPDEASDYYSDVSVGGRRVLRSMTAKTSKPTPSETNPPAASLASREPSLEKPPRTSRPRSILKKPASRRQVKRESSISDHSSTDEEDGGQHTVVPPNALSDTMMLLKEINRLRTQLQQAAEPSRGRKKSRQTSPPSSESSDGSISSRSSSRSSSNSSSTSSSSSSDTSSSSSDGSRDRRRRRKRKSKKKKASRRSATEIIFNSVNAKRISEFIKHERAGEHLRFVIANPEFSSHVRRAGERIIADSFVLARRYDQMLRVFAEEHRLLSEKKRWRRLSAREDIAECAQHLIGRLHRLTTGSSKLEEYAAHDPARQVLVLTRHDQKSLSKDVRRAKELDALIGGKSALSLPTPTGARSSSGASSEHSTGEKDATSSKSKRRRDRYKASITRRPPHTSKSPPPASSNAYEKRQPPASGTSSKTEKGGAVGSR